MSSYVIEGGRDGKARLNLLADVMLPTTYQLLTSVGLREGMKCLDVGCGGGHVTRLMARMVGPNGKVVGVDADDSILALAKQDSTSEGLENAEFRQADAAASREEEFDLVYARFLLTHLSEPVKCLDSMLKTCRPNGLVVVEDIEFTGSFCYPPCSHYEKYTQLYQQAVKRKGGDPNIGPKLPSMLRGAGASGVKVNVVQPAHLEGEGKLIASITLQRIGTSVLSEGLATEVELNEVIEGLRVAAEDPETLMSLPRVFQVWGHRN